jgi:hypothetical protein
MSTIAYNPRGTFVNDTQPPPVPVNATNLNAMDAGIKAAADGVDRLTARVTVVTATGTTALVNDSRDEIVLVDASLGSVIIQLPDATGKATKKVQIKALTVPSNFTLTIRASTAPAQTIDGAATFVLVQGQTLTIKVAVRSGNPNWYITGLSGSSGSGAVTIQDEGVTLPLRSKVNFRGAAITASDGGSVADVINIDAPQGTSGYSGIPIGFPDSEVGAGGCIAHANTIPMTRDIRAAYMAGAGTFVIGYPGAPNVETLHAVSIDSGNVLHLASGGNEGQRWTRFAHSAGEPIWWMQSGEVKASIYGSDFYSLQRMFLDMVVKGGMIDGGGFAYSWDHELLGLMSGLYWHDINFVLGSWTGETNDDTYILQGTKVASPIVMVDTVNDRIYCGQDIAGTYISGGGFGVGNRVFFNDPYNMGLPGGILPHTSYYVKSIGSDVNGIYFTLCANKDVANNPAVNITSSVLGAITYTLFTGLGKFNLRRCRVDFIHTDNTPAPCVMSIDGQQDSYVEQLYVRVFRSTNVGDRFMLQSPGSSQGVNFNDLNLAGQGAAGWRTFDLNGTLMSVSGWYFADTDRAIDKNGNVVPAGRLGGGLIGGLWGMVFETGCWSETSGMWEIKGCTATQFGQVNGCPLYAQAAIVDDSGDTAEYLIDTFYLPGHSGRSYYQDKTRNIRLSDFASSDPTTLQIGIFGNHAASGLVKRAGYAAVLNERYPAKSQGNGTTPTNFYGPLLANDRILFNLDNSHGDVIVQFQPELLVFEDIRWEIQKNPDPNVCEQTKTWTIQMPSGKTIDGASSKVFYDNLPHIIQVVAGNLMTMSNRAVPQGYAATNVSVDRAFDAAATTTGELANVVGTLISDLRSAGLVR